jgi:hypothetical protein
MPDPSNRSDSESATRPTSSRTMEQQATDDGGAAASAVQAAVVGPSGVVSSILVLGPRPKGFGGVQVTRPPQRPNDAHRVGCGEGLLQSGAARAVDPKAIRYTRDACGESKAKIHLLRTTRPDVTIPEGVGIDLFLRPPPPSDFIGSR